MNKYILICFLIFIIPDALFSKNNSKSDSLIVLLDSYLKQKNEFDLLKKEQINVVYNQIINSSDNLVFFDNCNILFNEYLYFNMDSAILYLEKQEEIIRQINAEDYRLKFLVNKISAFIQTGMYHEAIETVNSINLDALDPQNKSELINLSVRVYSALLQNAVFEYEKNKYKNIISDKRNQLFLLNDSIEDKNIYVYADLLIENNEYDKAREYLEKELDNESLSNHNKAIIHHLLAKTWTEQDKIKENLIYSAIFDIKASIKEYISLWQLAQMLYNEGDIDRAYRYMKISLQDASSSNIRLRTNTISNIYPIIESTYQAKVEKQQSQIFSALIVISILVIVLLSFLWILYIHTVKLKKTRKQLNERNENLKNLNVSLIDSSLIKEEYIGKYMEQSFLYLEKIEDYKRWIRKKIEQSTKNEIVQELKSSNIIEEELNNFLREFDKTFLSLFPNFVQEYNLLLTPSERSSAKVKDELDTELRIYALIRLGISDSDKIARFLGYSLSTIYNYRTKARNKALGNRDDFEEKVKQIGIQTT